MPDPATPPVLTERQTQVLKLIALGMCGKEIAWTLGVSLKTIEFHRNEIMQRLNLHGIADLTRYAMTHGLIGFNAKTTNGNTSGGGAE